MQEDSPDAKPPFPPGMTRSQFVGRTDSSVHVRLVNPREVAVQLVLEPWGETYMIPPDDVVDITIHGPGSDALEIAHEAEAIIVWGWPGSTIQAFLGTEELGSVQGRPPVPVSSPGLAVSGNGTPGMKQG